MSKVSTKVDKVGTDQVRGTPTTHYRATVDFAKAAAKGGVSPTQVKAFETSVGSTTFPVDLWIDGQGAARRIQFRFPLPRLSSGTASSAPAGTVTATEELYDFGTPVAVQAPPANQVADIAQLRATPSASVRTG